jgi:hypothetical protein
MNNKLANIKERILYLAEYQEGNKQTFFKKIGMSYGNFTGINKSTPINSNAIQNILAHYPDTNLNWLITGEGEMIIKSPYEIPRNQYGLVNDFTDENSNRLGPEFTTAVIKELEKIRETTDNDLNSICKKIEVSRQSYLKWVKNQSGITRKNYRKIVEAYPHISNAVSKVNTYSSSSPQVQEIQNTINQEIKKKIIEMPMENMQNYKLVLTIEFVPNSDTHLTPDTM